MIKKYYSLIIISLCLFSQSYSQELSWDQKLRAIGAVDSLISNYEYFNKFTQSGSDTITDESIQRFMSLFSAEDVQVFNEFVPGFYTGDYTDKPYSLSDDMLTEYVKKIKQFYPKGIGYIRINNLAVNFNSFQYNSVYIILEKDVKALSTVNGAIISNKDTVMITVTLYEDFTKALITRVSNYGKNWKVNLINDRDHDLVVNEFDKCPYTVGLVKYKGCPDPVGDLLTLNINGGALVSTLGFKSSDVSSEIEQNIKTGYSNFVDKTGAPALVEVGNIKSKGRYLPWQSYHIAAELELFFGNKRHWGFGIGALYTRVANELTLENLNATFKSIEENNDRFVYTNNLEPAVYKKVITGTSLTELEKFNLLSFPLYVKYKYTFKGERGYKASLKLSVGVAYTQSINSKTTFTGDKPVFSYNRYYYNNNRSANNLTGEFYYPGDDLNDNHGIAVNEEEVYNNHGIDFFNTPNESSYKINLQSGENSKFYENLTIIIKPQYSYLITRSLYLNAGAMFMYTQLQNKGGGESYQITTAANGEYKPLIQGKKTISFYNYGFNIGFAIGLFNN